MAVIIDKCSTKLEKRIQAYAYVSDKFYFISKLVNPFDKTNSTSSDKKSNKVF